MSVLDKYRKAAMHLHCLTEADKQWMLTQLSAEQSREITVYMNELSSLAVPKNLKFIKAAIEALDEKSEKELYELLNKSVLLEIESVLDIFETEPSWIGACLKLEYPGLVDSYITPRLSKRKLLEIDKYTNDAAFDVTNKLKTTVFDVVADRLRKIIPALNDSAVTIDFDTALQRAV